MGEINYHLLTPQRLQMGQRQLLVQQEVFHSTSCRSFCADSCLHCLWHMEGTLTGFPSLPLLLSCALRTVAPVDKSDQVVSFLYKRIIYFEHASVLSLRGKYFQETFQLALYSSSFCICWAPNLRWMTNGIYLTAMSLQQELSPAKLSYILNYIAVQEGNKLLILNLSPQIVG